MVRAIRDQRSKTPWSCGIGGPYDKHTGEKMDRQWTMLKIYNRGQLERLISVVYLNDPENEEQCLAKDDKLRAY